MVLTHQMVLDHYHYYYYYYYHYYYYYYGKLEIIIYIGECSRNILSLINESFAQILKFTNHIQIITLHERNIINLLEFLNSQVSLSTHITRPIDILSNTRILGLACYSLFLNICVCKHNNNHFGC